MRKGSFVEQFGAIQHSPVSFIGYRCHRAVSPGRPTFPLSFLRLWLGCRLDFLGGIIFAFGWFLAACGWHYCKVSDSRFGRFMQVGLR